MTPLRKEISREEWDLYLFLQGKIIRKVRHLTDTSVSIEFADGTSCEVYASGGAISGDCGLHFITYPA